MAKPSGWTQWHKIVAKFNDIKSWLNLEAKPKDLN
jgi:hypothetical protein